VPLSEPSRVVEWVDVVDGVGCEESAGVEFDPAVREYPNAPLVEARRALDVGVHRRSVELPGEVLDQERIGRDDRVGMGPTPSL